MSDTNKTFEAIDGTRLSEKELLETNRKRFGEAPDQIDMVALEKFMADLSEQEVALYMSLRPRANKLGLRLSQELSDPWRMVLIDNKSSELSSKTSSFMEIDARLRVLTNIAEDAQQLLGSVTTSQDITLPRKSD